MEFGSVLPCQISYHIDQGYRNFGLTNAQWWHNYENEILVIYVWYMYDICKKYVWYMLIIYILVYINVWIL